jgi:hypothetical protein
MELRRRPNHKNLLGQISAALKEADEARTRRQRHRALVALAGAQAELRRRQDSALDRELDALVAGKNWSTARVDYIESRLIDAQDRLVKEAT